MDVRWNDTSRNFPKVGHLEHAPPPRTEAQARADIERDRASRQPSRNRDLVPV